MPDSALASEYIPAAGMGDTLVNPRVLRIHCTAPSSLVSAAPIETCKPGMARNTALYFSRTSGASAHYTCDVAAVVQSVPEGRTAWHDGWNIGLSIEICGQAVWTREQWLSPEVYPVLVVAAGLARDLCLRHDIPVRWASDAEVISGAPGISTHADKSRLVGGDHFDPGEGFPRDVFLALIQDPSTDPGGLTMAQVDDIMAALANLSASVITLRTASEAQANAVAAVVSDRARQGAARDAAILAAVTSLAGKTGVVNAAEVAKAVSDAVRTAVADVDDEVAAKVAAELSKVRVEVTQ